MIKNHPSERIIRSRDKGVMKRRCKEELCLISQVEHRNVDEACNDDYCEQAMKKVIRLDNK